MTSIQDHSAFLQPATMPDDNMELASELGQDDIDIDIDFAAAPGDEDEVLEDANSEPVQDEDYDILLSSPVLGHDELMDDGENPSFNMNDVPYEGIHPEEVDLGDMSTVDQTGTNFTGTYDEVSSVPAIADESFDANWDQAQHGAESPGAGHAGYDQQDVGEPQNVTDTVENAEEDQESRISPHISSPADNGAPVGAPLLDVTTEPRELTPASIKEPQKETIPNVSEAEAAEDDVQDTDKVDSGHYQESNQTTSTAQGVVVTYQNAEYALVSSSESDDPDSYFLKDNSLTQGPLSEFMSALKDVIIEDLAPDDELCLAVDDLGIEINETSTTTFQMTFADIIDLHRSLLINDGISKPGPLHITLGIKPDFSKRLTSLAAGAAKGKGLSELVVWDEGSDSFQEEQSEFVENDPTHGDDHTEQGTSTQHSPGSREGAPIQDHTEQHLEAAGESAEYVEANQAKVEVEGGDGTAQDLQNEEEDDLIDYEDEVYEQTQHNSVLADSLTDQNGIATDLVCLKPAACFCAACTETLIAEYENRNEELGRRSLSRTVEEAELDVQSGANNDGATHSHTAQELFPEDDEALGHEVANEEFVEDHDEASYEEHFDLQEGEIEAHDPEAEHEDENNIPATSDYSLHEQVIATDASASFDPTTDEADHNPNEKIDTNDYLDLVVGDEIDFGAESAEPEHHGTEHDKSGPDQLGPEGQAHDADEIDYDDADGVPESNESEQTLVHDDAQTVQVDEIGYEDDDEPTLTNSLETKATVANSQVANGITGKRARADGEDVNDGELQETKRLRS